jgi:hypothetical protein
MMSEHAHGFSQVLRMPLSGVEARRAIEREG